MMEIVLKMFPFNRCKLKASDIYRLIQSIFREWITSDVIDMYIRVIEIGGYINLFLRIKCKKV